MSISDILLRILFHAPLTTKGSKLTSSQVDTNFIEVYDELFLISNPINVEGYDNGETYVGGEEKLVSFSSQLWRFISATDRTGISPGSNGEVWVREAINRIAHEDNNIAEVTRAELVALQVAETVKPGRIYHITDRNIYTFGITTTLVNLEGVLVSRNPDYQNAGGNVLGVWTSGIDAGSPGVQVGEIAIYNGLHWSSVTGAAGTAPDGDPTNWTELPTTDSSYIQEIDRVHYDIGNDVIIQREDKRGNKVITENSFIDAVSPAINPVDFFQWGNDNVVGNVVESNSILSCLNNLQSIKYNTIKDADITADMVTNDFLRNVITSGIIDHSSVTNDFTDIGREFELVQTILTGAILTGNSIPVQLVASPGAGRDIEVITWTQKLINTGAIVPYATNTTSHLITDTAQDHQALEGRLLLSTVLRGVKGTIAGSGGGSTDLQVISNKALMWRVFNGDPTAGNSDIKVFVKYRIINT